MEAPSTSDGWCSESYIWQLTYSSTNPENTLSPLGSHYYEWTTAYPLPSGKGVHAIVVKVIDGLATVTDDGNVQPTGGPSEEEPEQPVETGGGEQTREAAPSEPEATSPSTPQETSPGKLQR